MFKFIWRQDQNLKCKAFMNGRRGTCESFWTSFPVPSSKQEGYLALIMWPTSHDPGISLRDRPIVELKKCISFLLSFKNFIYIWPLKVLANTGQWASGLVRKGGHLHPWWCVLHAHEEKKKLVQSFWAAWGATGFIMPFCFLLLSWSESSSWESAAALMHSNQLYPFLN